MIGLTCYSQLEGVTPLCWGIQVRSGLTPVLSTVENRGSPEPVFTVCGICVCTSDWLVGVCCPPFIFPLGVSSSLDLTPDRDRLTTEYLSPVVLQHDKASVGYWTFKHKYKTNRENWLTFLLIGSVFIVASHESMLLTGFLDVMHVTLLWEEIWVSPSSPAPVAASVWDADRVLHMICCDGGFITIWGTCEPVVAPTHRLLNRTGQSQSAGHWYGRPGCSHCGSGFVCCSVKNIYIIN